MQTLSELPIATGVIPEQLLKQERERRRALRKLRKLRQQARDEIERLIQFLDESDLDPDLEPSLGFFENGTPGGVTDDRELDDSDDEPDGNDEPSLGSLTSSAAAGNQNGWGRQYTIESDLEDQHDDREPSLCGITVETTRDDRDLEAEDESEPSLGWTIDGRIGSDSDCELNEVLA